MSDISAPPAAPSVQTPQTPQTPQSGSGGLTNQPATNEAVISPSPNRPAPVGPQTPDKTPQQRRSETASDAVKAAFERAQNPPPKQARPPRDDKPAPKAAEAKAGHNQPPEETPKLDLKKRPDQQAQPRGDRGQFAPRQKDESQAGIVGMPGHAQQNDAQNGQTAPRLPPHAPFAEPPARVSEAARRDWAATPETVRGDIHRLHQEADGIYRRYRGDFETMETIRPFHQMAQQHGTTLQKALSNYVNMELKLRADPVAGLDVIVNNLNLRAPNGQKLTFRDIAYHVLSQSPERTQQLQLGNQQQAASQQIGALHQEISGLKQYLHQMHTQQQFVYTRSAVDQFAASHPRFDELGEVVRRELELGFDLDTAYKRAELLHPATHADQTRNTSAQTRDSTDRSIHGSPDVAPSNGASRRPKEASRTPRDAVLSAVSRYNGGI